MFAIVLVTTHACRTAAIHPLAFGPCTVPVVHRFAIIQRFGRPAANTLVVATPGLLGDAPIFHGLDLAYAVEWITRGPGGIATELLLPAAPTLFPIGDTRFAIEVSHGGCDASHTDLIATPECFCRWPTAGFSRLAVVGPTCKTSGHTAVLLLVVTPFALPV